MERSTLGILGHMVVRPPQKLFKTNSSGLLGGTVIKYLPSNLGDMSSIHNSGRFYMPWGN